MPNFARVLVLTALLVSTNLANGQQFLSPVGLKPGDSYRLAFVTQGFHDATSADIEDYNSFVSEQAKSENNEYSDVSTGQSTFRRGLLTNLDTEWKAIASTAEVSALFNTSTEPAYGIYSAIRPNGVPIYLIDGVTKVAENYNDFWDANLLNRIDLDQSGEINNWSIWTGTNPDGTGGDVLGGVGANFGSAFTTGRAWTQVRRTIPGFSTPFPPTEPNTHRVTNRKKLYAISGVLTAIPEPSSLVCIGLLGLGMFGHRKRNIRWTA